MTTGNPTDPKWDARFEEVVRPHLPRAAGKPLRADDKLAALGLDSLQTIQVLLDIEGAYEVSFPDELLTAETFATVGSLWSAVSSVAGR